MSVHPSYKWGLKLGSESEEIYEFKVGFGKKVKISRGVSFQFFMSLKKNQGGLTSLAAAGTKNIKYRIE